MKPIGGITLEESVKALQDVFVDHDQKGEPMRLIDADSLETHEIYEGEWKMVVYADDIDAAPTVEAKPVRHGKWIDTPNYYQRWKCSLCGCHTRDAAPNYCPNCGAKMEVDDERPD